MYPGTYNPRSRTHSVGRSKRAVEDTFRCRQCGLEVHTLTWLAGVQNRNHCPYCLCSRHVDLDQPGDRMSACKALMRPIGLTVKLKRDKYQRKLAGELMLIHRCSDCGKLSINRIAADDLDNRLVEIYRESFGLDQQLRHLLEASGICLLQENDCQLVCSQLGEEVRI